MDSMDSMDSMGWIGGQGLRSEIEEARLRHSKKTDAKKKSQFGQFLTPSSTADFMAGLFPPSKGKCLLLDAGAGVGSLSVAFLDRWRGGGFAFDRVDLDAFEIDRSLHPALSKMLSKYADESFRVNVHGDDFIFAASDSLRGGLFATKLPRYTHAILNPPYKKIASSSSHRLALRQIGLETVNLYSAFLALAVAQAAPGGQIVAIVPRSFCNGPYYRPFREFILKRASIHQMHLFDSRSQAFKDDAVLQENVIIHLEREGRQGSVKITTSTDDTFLDLKVAQHPFDQIVLPRDPELFIHIPTAPFGRELHFSASAGFTLADLGINVSTGPVVDFRVKSHLRDLPDNSTVPLLYPCHFKGLGTCWPVEGVKKPNAIERNAQTEKWLYPNDWYCVVRRFSSKEERRRIVASVVTPELFGDAAMLGFENHLNIIHRNKRGLSSQIAYGLAIFLNSSVVDQWFRRFNGHTQVNANDLKRMRFPALGTLKDLGQWAMGHNSPTQSMVDEKLKEILS
jgi:adenine-specific DNA-methyltransferase